ncbi:hypothetical protein [Gellertiella hungarica]|jgi:hypothetical protein|uniref:Uncharacterized protein n=1 Tax=Gellertiella hungarica TaxID=1572859 RepID=A0A7W6J9P1_9HYPH|nr:hypothetical protein [Gellertiella hungarica]MBB4067364.1 hypothetical protein [Gellertiella hungarica]
MAALDHHLQTARTIEKHALDCGRKPSGGAHDLSILLTDLLVYAHKQGIDFGEALERGQVLAWVSIPRPIRPPAGDHMARQKWPKTDGGRTLDQYAQDRLRSGQRVPFDAHEPEGEDDIVLPEPGDWAMRAARGIIADFDHRGAAMNDAFHPERVPEEVRIEIIDVMAAIMREALRQEREGSSEP